MWRQQRCLVWDSSSTGESRNLFTTTGCNSQHYFAVAQKKYVFIYDRDGVELHCLKSHMEPTRLEFLPYHWLLASVVRLPSFPSLPLIHILPKGNAGYLKYQDTSIGQLLIEHRTKLGVGL
jgi:U3 small nucleolar RNA-associated protein 7